MHVAATTLDTLIRPRLLVVSARHALRDYDRTARLGRLLKLPLGSTLPAPEAALRALIELERAQDKARRSHDARWSAPLHVALLTALLHEAQLCRAIPSGFRVVEDLRRMGAAE